MKSIISILSVVLFLTNGHSAKPVSPAIPESGGSEKLFASKWSPREVEGLTVMPTTAGKEAYLLFFPGQLSTVSGTTGCNSLKGTFELTIGHKIKFSPIANTKMMCPPDGNNTEQRFLSALAKADSYSFSENNLLLLNGKEVLSRLAATPVDEPAGK